MDWEEYITNIWTERLVWIRQLIISIMLDLRDVKFVVDRTNRNSIELGQILGNVYGTEAGQKFEALLRKYREMLQQIAATIKSGENADLLKEQWASIAEEIAEFLSQLNPYWEKAVVEDLIIDELNLEFSFATALKKEQFEQGIAGFDAAYDNARRAAQIMIDGTKMYLGLQ